MKESDKLIFNYNFWNFGVFLCWVLMEYIGMIL